MFVGDVRCKWSSVMRVLCGCVVNDWLCFSTCVIVKRVCLSCRLSSPRLWIGGMRLGRIWELIVLLRLVNPGLTRRWIPRSLTIIWCGPVLQLRNIFLICVSLIVYVLVL